MSNSELITELNSSDVLFGRGSGPNDHEGNIRFRALVSERKNEYLATNNRQAKANIAREIVNEVLKKNGRFLKKAPAAEAARGGIPKGVDVWVRVGDEVTMEKAKQALRQNREKGYTVLSSLLQGAGTVSPTSKAFNNVEPISFTTKQNPGSMNHQSDLMDYPQGFISGQTVGLSSSHPSPYAPVPIQSSTSSNFKTTLGAENCTSKPPDRSRTVASESTVLPQEIRSSVLSSTMRESFQITDLTSSFKQMHTKGLEGDFDVSELFLKKYYDSSADTMVGIIDESPDQNRRESGHTARALMRGSLLDSFKAAGSSSIKASMIDSVIDPNIFKSRRVSELRSSKSSASDRESVTMHGLRDSTISAMSILEDDIDDMSELRSSMMSVDLAGLRDSTSGNSVSESIFSDL
mmetsp:Transcript_8632/g.12488  ORF Transcript_8632/g.12488 Transcript_8632/m.12488 type:complete len:407 (+) Transcript_8632:891-2111(+)